MIVATFSMTDPSDGAVKCLSAWQPPMSTDDSVSATTNGNIRRVMYVPISMYCWRCSALRRPLWSFRPRPPNRRKHSLEKNMPATVIASAMSVVKLQARLKNSQPAASPWFLRRSLSSGTRNALSAPSPITRRTVLGSSKATWKMSCRRLLPKTAAKIESRMRPLMRETSV